MALRGARVPAGVLRFALGALRGVFCANVAPSTLYIYKVLRAPQPGPRAPDSVFWSAARKAAFSLTALDFSCSRYPGFGRGRFEIYLTSHIEIQILELSICI